MFIVKQSVWNICTHTAYNVHKTSENAQQIIVLPRCEQFWRRGKPLLIQLIDDVTDARGDSGVCALLLGTASDVRRLPGIPWLRHAAAGCR